MSELPASAIRCTRAGLESLLTDDSQDHEMVIRPIRESSAQVNCVLATAGRLVIHRAWVCPRVTVTAVPLERGGSAGDENRHGGAARTIVASVDERPVSPRPIVRAGPAALRAASVPGSYWPFRGFPAAIDAPPHWQRPMPYSPGTQTCSSLAPTLP